MMSLSRLWMLVCTSMLFTWIPFSLVKATDATITARDFRLYMDWQDGRLDPRLAKDSEESKLLKIAKSLGVSTQVLKDAIALVEPQLPTLADRVKQSIEQGLKTTPLEKRLVDVKVDVSQADVVAAVAWRCPNETTIDIDAVQVAYSTMAAAPLVQALAVWCVDDKGDKLFSAKIGRGAAQKIQASQIERFASSRYIRLFETIKRGPHD